MFTGMDTDTETDNDKVTDTDMDMGRTAGMNRNIGIYRYV
jgi:hypothetical protein